MGAASPGTASAESLPTPGVLQERVERKAHRMFARVRLHRLPFGSVRPPRCQPHASRFSPRDRARLRGSTTSHCGLGTRQSRHEGPVRSHARERTRNYESERALPGRVIPSFAIRDSSVVGFMPSCSAAPLGPRMRQPAFSRTRSRWSLSTSSSVPPLD